MNVVPLIEPNVDRTTEIGIIKLAAPNTLSPNVYLRQERKILIDKEDD